MNTEAKRLAAGDILPEFMYDTAFETRRSFAQTAGRAGKTALIFLRYFGCTLCQYDIHRLAAGYSRITEAGGQALVVLQSSRQTIESQLQKGDLPFEIICDPSGALYERFAVHPAASKARLADARTVVKLAKSMLAGYRHGAYEGDELQLPAAFVTDSDRRIIYAHYGRSAGDIPDASEIAEHMQPDNGEAG